MTLTKFIFMAVVFVGCGPGMQEPELNSDSGGPADESVCGHRVDPGLVQLGFNTVLNANGGIEGPQGRPLQEGWVLGATEEENNNHNEREYARIAAYMMPIRDALMCDMETLSKTDWLSMTEVLTLNQIKTEQDLSGTPPERVYSTEGIYELFKEGEDFHPMMKYLEEAELELKCIAFQEFDFTNPDGDDHCAIHNLPVGEGLSLP